MANSPMPHLWEKKMPLRRKWCGGFPVKVSILDKSCWSILKLPN